jgi:hypothetical protein
VLQPLDRGARLQEDNFHDCLSTFNYIVATAFPKSAKQHNTCVRLAGKASPEGGFALAILAGNMAATMSWVSSKM